MKCGNWDLLGGYGCAGAGAIYEKEIEIPDPHTRVTIDFNIFFIDTWDAEKLFIDVDG